MLIATFDHAFGLYVIGGGILLAGALLARRLLTVGQRHRHDVVVRTLTGLGALVLGSAGLLIGAVIILFGIAVNGCPPDAYECPL
jgi:hypothetical protein